MRVLDCFAGIGGFSLGLERAGFETVAFCEIEPYCQKVLAKHWPEVPIYDDIRRVTADRLIRDGIRPDVITGGFPCQDISDAGDRKGLAGERSGLWRELARLIGELRPRYAIMENVSALCHRGLAECLGDLAAMRYDAEWSVIPAYLVGARHRRDRVWFVAYPDSQGLQGRSRPALSGRQIADGHARSSHWWATEPAIHRVANGIPNRSHRLKALGNAVVPQIPELIGHAIMEAEYGSENYTR